MDDDGLIWAWPLDGSVSDKPEGAVTIQTCRTRCMNRCFRIGFPGAKDSFIRTKNFSLKLSFIKVILIFLFFGITKWPT